MALFVILTFTITLCGPLPPSYAQGVVNLPSPGQMVPLSSSFSPSLIRGITIHPENPFRFDFIIDTGHSSLKGEDFKKESTKLIKYFLASLTIPEEDLWVNLSPYEENRIIPEAFGLTGMGRDLLAQDYILKQLSASLIYPEEGFGNAFWERVYDKTHELYATTDIPVNTFNKVWIVPERAVIYENTDRAFVVESYLKVMLEEDYLALRENVDNQVIGTDQLEKVAVEQLSDVSSSIVREIILPEIEREVNEGKNFTLLRQIYHSLILATWFKRNLKESLLSKVYVEQNKIKGVDIKDKQAKEKIYQQYLEALKIGVFDYIKEDYDEYMQEVIPRKYFAGGANFSRQAMDEAMMAYNGGEQELVDIFQETGSGWEIASTYFDPIDELGESLLEDPIELPGNGTREPELSPGLSSDEDRIRDTKGMIVAGGQMGLWIGDTQIDQDDDQMTEYKREVIAQARARNEVFQEGEEAIEFVIDRRGLDAESFEVVKNAVIESLRAMTQEERARLSSQQQGRSDDLRPVVIALLDNSQHLFERDSIGGFVGIRSLSFNQNIPETNLSAILKMGVSNELLFDPEMRESFDSRIDNTVRLGITYGDLLPLIEAGILTETDGFVDALRFHGSEKLRARHREFLKEHDLMHHLIDETDEEFRGLYSEVREIFDRLLRVKGLNPDYYRFYISDESQVNAFYLRGSNAIVLNLGLLKLLSQNGNIHFTKDAIAFILAHEIQHLIQHREYVLNDRVDEDMELKPDWGSIVEKKKEQYLKEYDADWQAVGIMTEAGFNALEAPKIFRALLQRMEEEDGRILYLPFGSHPDLEPRTIELETLVRSRYWKNSSSAERVTRFSDDLLIPTSSFRDYQNRAYNLSSDQDFVNLISDAKDIRELIIAVSIGKHRRTTPGYVHDVDEADEDYASRAELLRIIEQVKAESVLQEGETYEEYAERINAFIEDNRQHFRENGGPIINDILRQQETENVQFEEHSSYGSQQKEFAGEMLREMQEVNTGEIFIINGRLAYIIVSNILTPEEEIQVIPLQPFNTKTRISILRREFSRRSRATVFANPPLPLSVIEAIDERIFQLVQENPSQAVQYRFYAEFLKKKLGGSDVFSSREIRTEQERQYDYGYLFLGRDRSRNEFEDVEVAVADSQEFDLFVSGYSTNSLIDMLEGLKPEFIKLDQSEREDKRAYEDFLDELLGSNFGEIKVKEGDYRELINAITQEIINRVQQGREDFSVILDLVVNLDSAGLEKQYSENINSAKIQLLSFIIEHLKQQGESVDATLVEHFINFLDKAEFLTFSFWGLSEEEENECRQRKEDAGRLLYAYFNRPEFRDIIVQLFNNNVNASDKIMDVFYADLTADESISVEQKFEIFEQLGSNRRYFSLLTPHIIRREPDNEAIDGDMFIERKLNELIQEFPQLSGVANTTRYFKRLITMIYLGGVSVGEDLLFYLYDIETRSMILSSNERALLRAAINANVQQESDRGSTVPNVISLSNKDKVLNLMTLFEFLANHQRGDLIHRFLMYVDDEKSMVGWEAYWNYLRDAELNPTPERLAVEKQTRTFSMFFGELCARSVDNTFPQITGQESRKNEGYSVAQMKERLENNRPQRFGRWDLMEDGQKDHVEFFDFLDEIFENRSFRESVEIMEEDVEKEGFFKDMMLYVLFVKKVLHLDISSEHLFDFEWLKEQTQGRQEEIRDDLNLLLSRLSWDRNIQRLNGEFVTLQAQETKHIDRTEYETEKDDYEDVRYYDIGGEESQLSIKLAMLDKDYLEAKLASEELSLEEKVGVIKDYFPHRSGARDKYIHGLLKEVIEAIKNERLSFDEDMRNEITQALELLQNLSIKEQLAVTFLDLRLKEIQESSGRKVSRDDELREILAFFPNFSQSRDELLQHFESRHIKTDKDYAQYVAPHVVKSPENIREQGTSDYMFWKDQIQKVIMNASASEKAEFMLWLMGLGEKPYFLEQQEYQYHISFDGLRENYGVHEGEFYSGIGKKNQEEFLRSLLVGSNGIFRDETAYDNFLDQLADTAMPSDKPVLKRLFKGVMKNKDFFRRQKILLGFMSHYNEISEIDNPELKEAVSIRIFLESMGFLGVKLGQFIAHSAFVEDGSFLQQELSKLKDSAEPISKAVVFDMLDKIFDGRAFEDFFESIDELIGSASIKVGFKATLKDGRKVAIMFKRPEVDKEIEADLQFLEEMLNEFGPELEASGIPIPAGLIDRLRELFNEELNFGTMEAEGIGEANNLRNLRANIIPRKSHSRDGVSYEFNVPVCLGVYENSLLIMDFVEGIPLTNESALNEEGIDLQVVHELLLEELLNQFFFDGFYHADLHAGNVIVEKRDDKVIVHIIDLGAASSISARNREILVGIMMTLWDKDNWQENREIFYGYFPQAQSKEGLPEQIEEVVTSDANPVQKLIKIFALLEKNKIQFQDEFKEFYSVFRFLKASEYLFTADTLERIKDKFFSLGLDQLKTAASALTQEAEEQFENIALPEVHQQDDGGMEIMISLSSIQQAYDAVLALRQHSLWSTLSSFSSQVTVLADVICGAFAHMIEAGEDLNIVLSAEQRRDYEQIRADIEFIAGLVRGGNLGLRTVVSAVGAIKRIMNKRDAIIDFILQMGISVDDIVNFVNQNVGSNASNKVREILESRSAERVENAQRTLSTLVSEDNTSGVLSGIDPMIASFYNSGNMAANYGDNSMMANPGGIDLNPNMINLQSQGEGMDFNIPFNPQGMEDIRIDGFTPIIFNITPVTNLPFVLGIPE